MMTTYRVSYKCHLLEHSEYGHEDIEAASEDKALKTFVKGRLFDACHIETYDGPRPRKLADVDPSRLRAWWEGDWLIVFRTIHETNMVSCPVCHGEGEVHREVVQQLLHAANR
jgi:hypothetical protein